MRVLSKRESFSLLSAYTESGDRHDDLMQDLQGYRHSVQPGSWKNKPEKTVKVFDISFDEAMRLAKKYDQEAFTFQGSLIPVT